MWRTESCFRFFFQHKFIQTAFNTKHLGLMKSIWCLTVKIIIAALKEKKNQEGIRETVPVFKYHI